MFTVTFQHYKVVIVSCFFEIKWSLSFLANVLGGYFLRNGGILAQITGPFTYHLHVYCFSSEKKVGWLNVIFSTVSFVVFVN